LNIPKTQRVNRKQAMFLLHFAHWVQSVAVSRWNAEGSLAEPSASPPPLRAVLLGGPGTGKTTLATVCKVFARFWLGEAADAAGAPSHAAARLIGGRTLHSLYKLPRHSLADKTASLSMDTLRRLKEDWSSVQIVFRDEISMVGSDQYYQMHHRAVTAKGPYTTTDGRVIACVGEVDQGDFIQLPPVDRLPLFEPLPWEVRPAVDSEKLAQHAHLKEESLKQSDKTDLRQQRYRYECYWGQQRWRDANVVTCPVLGCQRGASF
jgi:hypothetical protein